MKIEFAPPDIREEDIDAVVQVLRSGWITTGAKTQEFEQALSAFCGTEQTVCLSSATAALELTLRVLGIGAGDEVLVPAYTYTATASVVCHTGARPVPVDCARDSFCLDDEQLPRRINTRTKAIIPVDFAGIPCDYDRIFTAVEHARGRFVAGNALQHALGRVAVVADAAHALGALYQGRRVGAVADFTCFSFHAVKNLTTGEGGAVTWRQLKGIEDDALYRHYLRLALHGQSKSAQEKAQAGAWEYDVLEPAYKMNMPDILAALGLSQLRRYEKLLARRQALAALYQKLLCREAGILLPEHHTARYRSSAHLYPVRIAGFSQAQRNRVIALLAEQEIAANVHYKPLPMLTAYQNSCRGIADYPNACAMYQNEVTLPLHTLLTEEMVERVCTCFLAAVRQVRAEQ